MKNTVMKKKHLSKSLVCLMMVILFSMAASVPAFAVDLGYLDEHEAEGQELWEAYKKALEPLKSDEYPSAIERIDKLTERYYASYFEKITGRPQEEFTSLSAYDRALIGSTFIEPYYMNDLGQTYNNDTEWTYATDTFISLFKKHLDDNKDMKSAYNSLMYWQYGYYQSSGAFYNFVEERDSLDYLNDKYIEDMKNSDVNASDTTSETESKETESYIESQASEITSVIESYAAPVSSFVQVNNHKSNKAPYVIIGVLIVIVGVMAAMLLKKNKGKTEQK